MEQNKFDEQVKASLENRRLQPSTDAWEKLSNRLDAGAKKKHNNAFWYIGIAASIIGILLVALPIYNTKPVVVPVIVDTPLEKQIKRSEVAVEAIQVANDVSKSTKPIEQVDRVNDNSVLNESETTNVVTKKTVLKQEVLTFEDQKINEVVAKVEDLKSKNQVVTDEVIDALLLEAQKQIRFKKSYNNSTGIVDANMLLQEVETDLDQSFRSKVFDAIKASFGTVKTVVAQRND
ncbi:hypothetical protein ACFQ0I_05550 [Mariniflexile aquimaris]|uniref:Anti-sigma factor n=1 Tax=Mariniflexile aquimaris TaxID=881009 RepID=A0ABW3BQ07_9FLAO